MIFIIGMIVCMGVFCWASTGASLCPTAYQVEVSGWEDVTESVDWCVGDLGRVSSHYEVKCLMLEVMDLPHYVTPTPLRHRWPAPRRGDEDLSRPNASCVIIREVLSWLYRSSVLFGAAFSEQKLS